MKAKSKAKTGINPEILREQEERRRYEQMYSGELNRRLILLYALMASTSFTTSGINFGPVVSPAIFAALLD